MIIESTCFSLSTNQSSIAKTNPNGKWIKMKQYKRLFWLILKEEKKIDKIMKETGKIVGCKNDSHPYN